MAESNREGMSKGQIVKADDLQKAYINNCMINLRSDVNNAPKNLVITGAKTKFMKEKKAETPASDRIVYIPHFALVGKRSELIRSINGNVAAGHIPSGSRFHLKESDINNYGITADNFESSMKSQYEDALKKYEETARVAREQRKNEMEMYDLDTIIFLQKVLRGAVVNAKVTTLTPETEKSTGKKSVGKKSGKSKKGKKAAAQTASATRGVKCVWKVNSDNGHAIDVSKVNSEGFGSKKMDATKAGGLSRKKVCLPEFPMIYSNNLENYVTALNLIFGEGTATQKVIDDFNRLLSTLDKGPKSQVREPTKRAEVVLGPAKGVIKFDSESSSSSSSSSPSSSAPPKSSTKIPDVEPARDVESDSETVEESRSLKRSVPAAVSPTRTRSVKAAPRTEAGVRRGTRAQS